MKLFIDKNPKQNEYCKRDDITELVIQDGVTSISESAFKNCPNLQTVVFPKSLETIKKYAFSGCINLTEIVCSEGLKTIGEHAFEYCKSLKTVNFPNSLFDIKECAFLMCSSLTKVNLPHVDLIGIEAFKESGVKYLTVQAEVISKKSFAGCHDLYEANIDAKIIHSSAFGNSRLTYVTLKNVVSLSNSVFSKTLIRTICIPATTQSIGAHCFDSCKNLKDVVFEKGSSLEKIGSKTFAHCVNIEEISIPDSVTVIGQSAFMECLKLRKIHLPEQLKVIQESVFKGDTALSEFNFPANLKSIAHMAFQGCTNLNDVNIPGSVKYIGVKAFANSRIQNLTLNEGLDEIDISAFSGALKDNHYILSIPSTVTKINGYAFFECSAITKLIFDCKCKSMDGSNFRECKNLEDVYIGSSVKTIFGAAFNGCTSLVTVHGCLNVTRIDSGAFAFCKKLDLIELPAIQYISETAFF